MRDVWIPGRERESYWGRIPVTVEVAIAETGRMRFVSVALMVATTFAEIPLCPLDSGNIEYNHSSINSRVGSRLKRRSGAKRTLELGLGFPSYII